MKRELVHVKNNCHLYKEHSFLAKTKAKRIFSRFKLERKNSFFTFEVSSLNFNASEKLELVYKYLIELNQMNNGVRYVVASEYILSLFDLSEIFNLQSNWISGRFEKVGEAYCPDTGTHKEFSAELYHCPFLNDRELFAIDANPVYYSRFIFK